MYPLKFVILSLVFKSAWTITDQEYTLLPPLYHMDNYDNCLLYGDEAVYCKIALELSPINKENVSDAWKILEKTHYLINNKILRHTICLTERCPKIPKAEILTNSSAFTKEVSTCYGSVFEHMGLNGEVKFIVCGNKGVPVDRYDVIFGTFMITIIGLVLFAWYYDCFHDPEDKTIFGRFISSFSLGRNWKRLITVDLNDSDIEAFSCLQGVRVLNCSHIIFFHTMIIIKILPILNPWFLEQTLGDNFKPLQQPGIGYNLMQPFFFLSAWLLTYKCLKEIERKKEMTLKYISQRILIRYLRLTPLMMISVFFMATWAIHVSDGPYWDLSFNNEREFCRTQWWKKLTYIWDQSCEMFMQHLWSLVVDFYMYIAILVALWMTGQYPKKLLWLCGGVWLFHIILTFLQAREFDFSNPTPKLDEILKIIALYSSTTTNMLAALSGATFSYIFYNYKEKLFTTKKSVWITWMVVLFTAYLGLFFPLDILTYFTTETQAFFINILLTRTLVNIAIGLFILAMTKGRGGGLRRFLASKPMYILGRLTYAAYLLHPFISKFRLGILRAPIYLNHFLILYHGLMDILVTFSVAIPVTLFFEMPFEEVKNYVIRAMRKSGTETKKSD